MKPIVLALLVSLPIVSACKKESAAPPTTTPTTPAASSPETQKPVSTTPAPTPAAPKPAAPAPQAPKPTPAAPTPAPETATTPPAGTTPVTETKPAAAVDLDAESKTLMAKAEQPDASIEIQHVLISFQGAGVPGVTRTKEEAKALAAKVYAEAIAGADFLTLVKTHTNDSAPGIYPMTKAGRAAMVKSFGDVGFRLKVDEIGIAIFDPQSSPYGWHIIKRLK